MSDFPRQVALNEWRAGWLSVVAAGAIIGSGPAFYFFVSSLFIEPIQHAFGWSRSEMATIAALPLFGALSAPFFGAAIDRYGMRPVAISCMIIVTLAYLGLALTSGALPQVIALMLLLGIAVPGTTGLALSRAVVSWFDRSRGLALGMMTAVVTLASAALAPAMGWLIAEQGFRIGYAAMALLMAGIGIPLTLFALRERSEPLVPDPEPEPGDDGRGHLSELVKMPAFWLLMAGLALTNITTGGVVTQLAPIVGGHGVAAADAGFILSLFALATFVGRIIIGFCFDRFAAARVIALALLLAAVGAVSLMRGAPTGTLYIGVMAVALVQGAEADINSYFVSRLFAFRLYGRAYGLVQAVSMLGTAMGLIGFGYIYDGFGSYDLAIGLSSMLMLVAAGIFLILHRYMRVPDTRAQAAG